MFEEEIGADYTLARNTAIIVYEEFVRDGGGDDGNGNKISTEKTQGFPFNRLKGLFSWL